MLLTIIQRCPIAWALSSNALRLPHRRGQPRDVGVHDSACDFTREMWAKAGQKPGQKPGQSGLFLPLGEVFAA